MGRLWRGGNDAESGSSRVRYIYDLDLSLLTHGRLFPAPAMRGRPRRVTDRHASSVFGPAQIHSESRSAIPVGAFCNAAARCVVGCMPSLQSSASASPIHRTRPDVSSDAHARRSVQKHATFKPNDVPSSANMRESVRHGTPYRRRECSRFRRGNRWQLNVSNNPNRQIVRGLGPHGHTITSHIRGTVS